MRDLRASRLVGRFFKWTWQTSCALGTWWGALPWMLFIWGAIFLGIAALLAGVVVLMTLAGPIETALAIVAILALALGAVALALGLSERGKAHRPATEVREPAPTITLQESQLEVIPPPLTPTPDFPDIEFEIRTTGYSSTAVDPETGQPFAEAVVIFGGFRITNHEPEPANLTFYARYPVKPEFEMGLDTHPLRPATKMPILIAPRSSETITLYFRRGYFPPDEHLDGPAFLDVEDHLSGKATRVPTHQRWRPAKDGAWTWKR